MRAIIPLTLLFLTRRSKDSEGSLFGRFGSLSGVDDAGELGLGAGRLWVRGGLGSFDLCCVFISYFFY